MSSTNRATGRSMTRSNPEEMMWQGIRPKGPNQSQQEGQIGLNRIQMDQSRQNPGMPSIKGEQSVYGSVINRHPEDSAFSQNQQSVMTRETKEEPNFPVNPLMSKHYSLQQPPMANTLQAHKFASIVGSDESIAAERRSHQTVSQKSSKPAMKKIDYTDISMAMVQKQRQQKQAMKNGRGKSLRASRFTDAGGDQLQATLVANGQINGEGNFATIDVNFKKQIDMLKQGRAQSMVPAGVYQNDTPMRNNQNLQHNDSIYQSEINQSVNSGLGLTPKRLQKEQNQQNARQQNSPGRFKNAAPFATLTDQKVNRVPPILLANENTMKYMGNRNQGQNMQNSGRFGTAKAGSFLSRDPGSTAYSQPEDSMFQTSEASISQQRSRFPPNLLPKIGSANPEMNARMNKRGSAFQDSRSREISAEQELRGRNLSTAQPKDGFKFSKSQVQSQQQRSRAKAAQYNDTGFNWKQVDIKTSDGNFDSTKRSGMANSIHVPRAYIKSKPKVSPNQLLDMMGQVNHKGPIQHRVVNSSEFERLAQEQVDRDGDKPMVEKTIFIVKPIYVPISVAPSSAKGNEAGSVSLTSGKKRLKLKKQQQKAIYMERPKPPNYTNAMSNVLDATKGQRRAAQKSKKRTAQMLNSRSRSPFSLTRADQQSQLVDALNQSSVEMSTMQADPQLGIDIEDQRESPTRPPIVEQKNKSPRTAKDFKKLLQSSQIIDEIFHQRTLKVEAEKKAEEAKKAKEEEEHQEVIQANKSLKESLIGRASIQSKMTLAQQMSVDPTGAITDDKSSTHAAPVDTTQEFLNTINDQLHNSGAGIQIIMEESKDASWFKKKQRDEEKVNKVYSKVRKWQVAPKTFQATELDADQLHGGSTSKGKMMNLRASQGSNFEEQSPPFRADGSRASIPQFQNSPSGKVLSERRWKSPTQKSQGETSQGRLGGSLSPNAEPKSPFTGRSNTRGSVGGSSQQNIVSVQDQKFNQLSLERVHAMKLLTKKMKKVGKVPVEFENAFCSHIDPGTSAQLIAANELANIDPDSKYARRWQDKDHVAQAQAEFGQVPKKFYTNFKTNLVRDAHYMAKAIVNARSQSPINSRASHHLDSCEAKHGASVSCGCAQKQKPDLRKRFRSYIGGVRSAARSKDVKKRAYDLHKPYRPCRRTCCSNHNPLFHAQRMQQEHLQRMHASATKLMIMSVIPERPYSADSATRALKAYQKEIDYFESVMHGEALERKEALKKKKMGRHATIEERGEGEEEEKQGSTLLGAVGMSTSSNTKNTLSNMNLMKSNLDGATSFSLDDQKSLTAIECKYLVSVLKNRSVQANQIKEKQFEIIYKKARTTLKIQMKKLLLKKQFYIIDKQYQLAEDEKQTSTNLIKILARCLKMYDAQNEILKIITLIEQRNENLVAFKKQWRAEQPDSNALKKLYVENVRLSARVCTEIRILKSIEKALNRPFMFHGKMYDGDFMHQQIKRKRTQILQQFPELTDASELKMFIVATGEMSDVRNIPRDDYELKEEDPLWSSSSEEDSQATESEEEFQELGKTKDMAVPKMGRMASQQVGRRTMI